MPVIVVVLFCHFLTAFTALGMPLFMPRMLSSLGAGHADYLIGIMFVVPAVCTAFSAPWWGRFADSYGKKNSLLRAQLGLTLGFLISGFADSLGVFSFGLVLQGISGGTLAASNAYLSSTYKGPSLAKSLNLTQFSARLALVSAPVLLGFFTAAEQPLLIYRYLALLPFSALLLSFLLPRDAATAAAGVNSTEKPAQNRQFSQLLYLQFLFCFAMVVTFPYFLPYVQSLGESRDTMAGLYYSLPHLVYLLLAFYLAKLTLSARLQSLSGFVILGTACAGQFLLHSIDGLIVYRLMFGLGMLLSYSGLHLFLSERLQQEQAGLSFGRFDAWGKWAGVSAGLAAGLVSQHFSLHWPFLLAAAACTSAVFILVFHDKESFGYVNSTTES
ncbi:MFS transporter [Psychromonas aquimarina]|uniref:MFS transporter n=1 Tax=Psychromonas aquimarina TaxID=444919 RepID=UPI00040D12CA|nr:MFS transporter [Psychromonas aquimarina]